MSPNVSRNPEIQLSTANGRAESVMSVAPVVIPPRMRGVNRAEICDVNFQEFVRNWDGEADAKP